MMHRMDIGDWQDFNLREDLGFVIYHGRRLNKANRIDGEVPFVTAGHENRGVKQYIETDRTKYKNPITVDMFGNCFYHPYECCGDDNVYFFVNDKISDLSKLFISTSINVRTRHIYNYNEQFRQRDANSLTVTLPVTESGEPDWEYMDSYMSKIMGESEYTAEILSTKKFLKTKMDVNMWQGFEMSLGLGFDIFHGRRLNKANRIDGEVPFVTAGHENRGVKQYIETDRTKYKNPITVDMFGNCFYHPYECCGDDNVYFFVNDKISDLSKLFISTSINVRTRHIYNYNEQFRQRDANSLTVTLPVTESGEPDWEYMDSYMSKIMDESQVRVDNLEQLIK